MPAGRTLVAGLALVREDGGDVGRKVRLSQDAEDRRRRGRERQRPAEASKKSASSLDAASVALGEASTAGLAAPGESGGALLQAPTASMTLATNAIAHRVQMFCVTQRCLPCK